MPAVLEISGLNIQRGSTKILRSIDWRVEAGQHWVILGPNGCGKTSLLKAVTGYLSPSSGRLAVLGRVYGETDWRELRLKIGIVTSALAISIPPAEPAVETVVSGRYAQLDLWKQPTRADLSAARRLLGQVGAAHVEGREWIFLSQGERQRILIARALMARPRILILDEPCAGLDPVAREEFLRFVDALAQSRRGPSLVLVTHHVEEIMPAFSHAMLLKAGSVHAAGVKRAVLRSRGLSEAFGAPMTLRTVAGRYRAAVGAASKISFKKRFISAQDRRAAEGL